MLAVFVGDDVDENFRKTVCNLLRKHIKTLEISGEKIMFSGFDAHKLVCVFSKNLKEIEADGSIVFLNNCADSIQINGERCCVLDGLNQNDLVLAQKSSGEVITCGRCTRDTLTFSSCTEENCVISLQRRLRRLDESLAEPFELPFECQKNDDRYAILCASLILILLGII